MRQLVEIQDGMGKRIRIVLDVDIEYKESTNEYIITIPFQRYREAEEFASTEIKFI